MNTIGIIYLVGFVVSIIVLRFIYLYDKSKLTFIMPNTGREELSLDTLIIPFIWPITALFYTIIGIIKLLDKLLIKLINKFK